MKKTIQWLAVLLGVQLLLALGVGFSDSALSGSQQDGSALLSFDKTAIDRITLEGPKHDKLVLVNKDGRWRLPEAGDFPADGARVTQLLDRLARLARGDVVAASHRAHERFKVGDAHFERRITLAKGDTPQATLYLGSSPALRRLHARRQGDDAVHIVELALFDLPLRVSDWQDKALLTLPPTEIAAIDLDGLRIERAQQDAPWTARPLPEGMRVKSDAAARLSRQLADLRFDAVLGQEAKPEYGLKTPLLQLKLTRRDGTTVDYLLGQAAGQESYTLKVSSHPEYFRIPNWTAEELLAAARREALLEAATADTAASADKSQ